MSKYPFRKPFDLEKAQAGAIIVTRSDQIITDWHNFENLYKDVYVIYFKINGDIKTCNLLGEIYEGENDNNDLFILPETKCVWINMFRKYESEEIITDGVLYQDKETAARNYYSQGGKGKGNWLGAHPIQVGV